MLDKTMTFSLGDDKEQEMKKILTTVYDALQEKGYNPINQIVGYLLSEDPTYITTHNNARSLIRRLDRDELLRALVNLVENAARYTPQGGAVTLESRVRRAPDGAGRAVFTVRDTGPGFTPEALAKGMQPLYTGEKSRPQDGHMGLGLTFAADVARRHGGALALRNAAGGGAVAELSFPVWG